MKINWAARIIKGTGDNLGYTYHSGWVHQELESLGVEWDKDARVCLHWCPPHFYRPVAGRFNALYTMFETWPIPPRFAAAFLDVDLVMVPCLWCAERLAELGVAAEVVSLGVDQKVMQYAEHAYNPGERFYFVYVGAPSKRKGWELIAPAWQQAFTAKDPAFLIYKTTTLRRPFYTTLGGKNRVMVDSRPYAQSALVQLYQLSHVTLLPSLGEGFGATAAEAMACGSLVLAPAHTGLADFVSHETALVLPHEMLDGVYADVDVKWPTPTIDGLAAAMRQAFETYDATKAIRCRAAENISKNFTLAQTAREILRRLENV